MAPAREPKSTAEIAALIDHAILHPTVTTAEMVADLDRVRVFPLATVCIKPYGVPLAVEHLAGTGIGVCTVIGFPHGSHLPEVKGFEAERAIQQGAREIDMVVNIGWAKGQEWDRVREDIGVVKTVCDDQGARLKVIFENDFLPEDEVKIGLCQVCTELDVAFVKTSTGFGYAKQPDGSLAAKGAQIADLQLMRAHCPPRIGVKASGGVRNLDDLLSVVAAGANRVGTTSTLAILGEARVRFGE